MSIFDNLNLDEIFSGEGDPRLPFQKFFQSAEGSRIRFGFGIISDNKDPDKLARVKVSFSQLEGSSESEWSPVVRPFAGPDSGLCIIPEVGDKVVCAFINDNVRIPVVLGIVFHKKQKPPIDPVPGNEKKIFSTPGGIQVLLEDFLGMEKMTVASGDGKMKLVMSVLGGINISNSGGKIIIESKEVLIDGLDNGAITAKNELTLKAKGEIKIEADQNLALTAKKDNTIKGKSKIKLEGSSGVTAKMKQIATEKDQVIGIDMHDLLVPAPSGMVVVPLIPNPYIGQINDKVSKDVMIKGKAAATKGSKSKNNPPNHFVPPPAQFKKAAE